MARRDPAAGGRGRLRRGARMPQDRARRRFARRQWARRWLTWRYVLVAVLLVGGLGLGGYAVYFSSWLRTEGVQVVGTERLRAAQVRDVADVPTGRPLARVDLAAIERRVRTLLPTVKTVDASRKWPHEVRIEIRERTPVAVLDAGDGFSFLDEGGTAFRPQGVALRKVPPGLPRVKVGAGADDDALAEAAAVVAALDAQVAELVDHVAVRTVDQIQLHLRDGRQVRWGSAEQSDDKADVLLVLLERKAQVYDVSVPGQPTTR